ncbi:PAS domain S-box protein [Desulfonatronospira sp.]|uniref:PAS domain S-box protein n=1 Tax=Desulfonatronospira sp. TaxID=1962951 RepID=UPI0025B9AD7B|nr:PAS domain S-box protein [Desulfonatronospira sp.]
MPQKPASKDFSVPSPEECQDLFTNAPIGIFTSTPEGRLLSVNPALAKMFGYETPPKMLESVTDIASQLYADPADREEFKRLLSEKGELVNYECRFKRKDGTEFWVSLNAHAVRDKDGNVVNYQSFVADISERKRSEETLRASEERTRHLNAVLQAIRNVNQLITQENDRDALLQKSCENLVQTRGYYSAWIALLDENRSLKGLYHAGLGDGPGQLRAHLANEQPLYCMDAAVQDQAVLVVDDPFEQCSACPLSISYQFRAGMCGRLEYQERLFGVLCVSTPGYMAYDQQELDIFQQLAGDIAFALHNLDMERERERHLETLHMYEVIISTVKDPMSIVDRNYVYQVVNQAYLDTFARSREEIVGHTVEDLLGSEAFYNIVKPRMDRCFQGEEVHYEAWFDTPRGDKAFRSVRFFPYLDAEGEVQGVIVNARDNTEPKRLEEALRRSKEYYRTLFENSPISLWEEDFSEVKDRLDALKSQGIQDLRAYFNEYPQEVQKLAEMVKVLNFNQATLKLYRASSKEELFAGITRVFAEESPEDFMNGLLLIAQGTKEFFLERKHLTLDGEPLDVELYWSVAPGHEESYSCVLVSIVDVTRRKQAEEEIRSKNQQLQKSNADKDRLFSYVAHDLKSPISGFVNLTQVLSSDIKAFSLQELEHLAGEMHKSSENLYALLEDLLQWAKMKQGILAYTPESVCLNDIVTAGISVARNVADKKEIDLWDNVPRGMNLFADQQMVYSIIRNLLFNAIKFTHRGENVSIHAHQEGSMVRVMVHDDGMGMDQETAAGLFAIDQKRSVKGTEGEKGTGLGLVLCKEFVEKHGGRIWVESEPGKGTTVSFTVPYDQNSCGNSSYS